MSRALLSALRAQATVIGKQQSPQKSMAKVSPDDPKVLKELIRVLSDVSSIKEIQLGGLDQKNLIKLHNLIDTGRDFTDTGGEMQGTIRRFLQTLFDEKPNATRAQIDEAIEAAVIRVIALRLRTGGGDVRSGFKPLSQNYLNWKRKKYPNSKGIGWATGELAHEWAEYGNVRIVR